MLARLRYDGAVEWDTISSISVSLGLDLDDLNVRAMVVVFAQFPWRLTTD